MKNGNKYQGDCIDFTILNKNMCLGDECMAPRCLYIHGKYFRLLMFAKIFFSETITPKITNVNLAKIIIYSVEST